MQTDGKIHSHEINKHDPLCAHLNVEVSMLIGHTQREGRGNECIVCEDQRLRMLDREQLHL